MITITRLFSLPKSLTLTRISPPSNKTCTPPPAGDGYITMSKWSRAEGIHRSFRQTSQPQWSIDGPMKVCLSRNSVIAPYVSQAI